MLNNTSKKLSTDLEKQLPIFIRESIENKVSEIKEVATETYEDLLFGLVADRDSLSIPEDYYEEYSEAINNFEFIPDDAEEVKLVLPDAETFKFEGSLAIFKFIVEGTAGKYLELPDIDLTTILKTQGVDDKVKRRLKDLPGVHGNDIPSHKRFGLLPVRGTLYKTVESILGKKLVKFPFSNSQPIDLFEPVHDYVDKHISSWIEDGIQTAIGSVKQRY